MRIGFSTGALAPGDVPAALALLAGSGAAAVELSALRLAELGPLVAALPALDLAAYPYVSVHAPSRFTRADEPPLVDALAALPAAFPVVVHPDTIHDLRAWRPLAPRLLVENMDLRKAGGRTARELGHVFDALPEAAFCFDVGHAHQIDRTLGEAEALLRELGARLGQLHVSEVAPDGSHRPLGPALAEAFRALAAWVPPSVPLIVESPAGGGEIAAQMALAARAFSR